MVNSKNKGTRWEREAAKVLNKNFGGVWKRVPMSGAMGTILNIPTLQPDLIGKYPFISKTFLGEAKVGYGKKQTTLKKEWFDKIKLIAERNYGFPLLIVKFDNIHSGVKYFVAMDLDTWDSFLSEVKSLWRNEMDEFDSSIIVNLILKGVDKLSADKGIDKKTISVWDAFTYAIKKEVDIGILTLKADIEILEFVAKGNSVSQISKILNISSKDIFDVINLWGLKDIRITLDVNPIEFYEEDVDLFKSNMLLYTGKSFDYSTIMLIYNNITRYLELKDILERSYDEGE